ncbi:MAG TPA: hypothetical protein VGN16_12625 [Acidobacteriaceae bacterium]
MKKVALCISAGFVLAIGGELLYLHHRNVVTENTEIVRKDPYEKPKMTDDDAVFFRKERPDSLKDERKLIGTTIWVSAGNQMDYYHYANHHADYAHSVGTLQGAEPLLIKDVFEQVAPKSGVAVARVAAGQKHVLLAFTLPKSANPDVEYAVPVGNYDNGNYTFISDDIFFYDDPHVLYKHWGPEMWAHIDKHEAVPGMSENQAMMALGEVLEWHGKDPGNRSITYHIGDKETTIKFEDNKAVTISPLS